MKRNAELKLAYKLNPPKAGVIAIRNLETGEARVEASRNADALLGRRQFELKMGAHRDALLQREWRALGAERFVFEVLAVVEPSADPAFDADAALAALLARHAPPRG